MIKVSIIVPAFNIKEKLLNRCVDSLVNQTLPEIEIILIDDASTKSETIRVLEYFRDQYVGKVILITHKINKKAGGARNSGLKVARGAFVCYVDADDYVEKDMLKILYTKAIEVHADIVDFNYTEVREHGEFIKDKVSIRNIDDPKEYLLYPGPIWSKLYSRRLLIENNLFFPEHMFYEDNPIAGVPLLYAKKISKVENHLLYYVKHPNSVVANKRNTIDEIKLSGEMYIENMIQRGFFDKHRDVILAKFFRVYFLNTYKFIMRHRSNYFDELAKLMNGLEKYGVDMKSPLIQKQLRKKHKVQLFLLYNFPAVFKFYTNLKYRKVPKTL